jgi:outer membrane lipoprotein SlyB
MNTTLRLVAAAGLSGTLTLTGCAYNPSSADVYSASQTQREQSVRMAVVESVRAVRISSNDGQPTGLGAIGGGALGAVAGSALGGGRGSILTGIAGGIAGAVAGNAVENSAAIRSGVELTVRLDNGDLRSITQAANGEVFQAGDRVRLLSSGGVTRVTH